MVKWNVESPQQSVWPCRLQCAPSYPKRCSFWRSKAKKTQSLHARLAPRGRPAALNLFYTLNVLRVSLKLLLASSSYLSWQKSWSPSTNTDLYVLRYCYIQDDLKLQSGESVIINVIFCLLKQRERYHSKDNPKFWIHFITNTNITDHNKKRLCKGRINHDKSIKRRIAEVRLFTRRSTTQTHYTD